MENVLPKTKSKFIQELATTKAPVEKPTNHYVNNKDFVKRIVEYKKACRVAKRNKETKPRIPDAIGKYIYDIAENLSRKPGFAGYTFKSEMIGDACENCVRYFDNFDPKISHYPFTYFTKIAYYAFIRRIKLEKLQLYTKYKYTQQHVVLDEMELQEMNEDGTTVPFELYDNISEFIGKFEDAQKKAKKEKKKAAKKKLELLLAA
jgi:hypothetical protein